MNLFIKVSKELLLILLLILTSFTILPAQEDEDGWQRLIQKADTIGKSEWRPMLKYVANLHQKSTHPKVWPFDYEWEEIGPGYVYGPAFGHWDIVHQTLDVMSSFPEHSLHQLLNNLKNQEPNGLIPGCIWMPSSKHPLAGSKPVWNKNTQGHPPMWVFAADDYLNLYSNDSLLHYFYSALIRQITWFENSRNAENEGFYYNDILTKEWESGIDEGVRFDETKYGKWACIDATSQVFYLYRIANKWSEKLGINAVHFQQREEMLRRFIQEKLYNEDDGIFYDIWAKENPQLRTLAFETFFPLICAAANQKQADRLIDEYLLDTTFFNTPHPVPTVGKKDHKFELRMWRGPSWNSMTYWIARGCINYGRTDAAKIILEKALDQSAIQFNRTGKIWEFYHPLGGNPETLKRKPQTQKNQPCADYLGHNPLIAMAELYDKINKIKK